MRILRRGLAIVLVMEVLTASCLIYLRVSRPAPPEINTLRLDPLTASDLNRVRQTVTGTHEQRDWRELAEAYLGHGYYVAAEQCFRQSAEMNPKDLQALYGRGFSLERIGHTAAATSILQEVAARAPSDLATTCWYQVGRCHLREENSEAAEVAFRRISEFPPAAYQLAKLLIRSGRSDEAVPILDVQLAALPNSLKLLQLRMHAAEQLSDWRLEAELHRREERGQYQLVLEYNQNFISMFAARYGLSRLLSTAMRLKTEGTLTGRRAALNKALVLIRSNELWQYRSVLLAAAHVELGLGNADAARQLIDEIERYTQSGIDVLDLRALLEEARGNHDAAWEIWTRAALMKPTKEIHLSLSASMTTGNIAEKKKHRALADFEDGLTAWRNNDLVTSMTMLTQCRAELPDNDKLLYYLALAQWESGRPEEALLTCVKSLTINPDNNRAIELKQHLQKLMQSSAVGDGNA